MSVLDKTLVLSDHPKLLSALEDASIAPSSLKIIELDNVDSAEFARSDLVIYPVDKATDKDKKFQQCLKFASPGQIRLGVYESDKIDYSHVLQHSHGCINLSNSSEVIASDLANKISIRSAFPSDLLVNIAGKTRCIPCHTPLRSRALEELSQPQPDIRRLAQIISKDVGLLARVLMVANLDATPSGESVSSVYEALELVDNETLKFLMGPDGPLFEPTAQLAIRMLKSITDHSAAVARLALLLAIEEGRNSIEQNVIFSSAMLHEIGRLFLSVYETGSYGTAFKAFQEHEGLLYNEETRVFETPYTEIGARLLNFWKIPSAITRMIADHQNPFAADCSSDDPVWVLHSANTIVEETSPRGHFDPLMHKEELH
jgi:HD-like signal output (HDOD) protein